MNQEENKYSRIQYFLWLVAGSEISVLKKCPNDYNRHANIGLMIIITSMFAGMTAFVAGSTFEKENTIGVMIFAFVWAFLIFSLDRSMVNSIKKDPTKTDKSIWGYFAPRLVLAIILSFFMSIPIEHIVFKEKIAFQMNENNKNNWLKRKEDLNKGYDTKKTETNLNIYKSNSDKLDKELQKDCNECPLPEYKTLIANSIQIERNELPILLGNKKKSQMAVDYYSIELNRIQTQNWNENHSIDQQVSKVKLKPDNVLKKLYGENNIAKNQFNIKVQEVYKLRNEAQIVCDNWKAEKKKDKARVDSLKTRSENLLVATNDSIRIQGDNYKKDIELMQGFDTQFVTLFLMPDAGVQVLKWLIFLALLVIEILPTFLKLKTPIGQYDWEIYKADVETEIQATARLDKFKTESIEIENYRKDEEVKMNKNLIDKVVSIEERLANEMLDEWEVKARIQIKNNVQKSQP
ncbi:DUF4407 domain-containing protein [Aquirufa nivalisilvae]